MLTEENRGGVRTSRAVEWLGIAAGVVFVAGGLLVVVTYKSLREGPLPVVALVWMMVLGTILWTTLRLEVGSPGVLSRWGPALALAGLTVSLGFFGAILAFGGFAEKVPEWMANLGTFVGSLATLVVLPLGFVLVSIAALRESRLPGWARPLPLIGTLLFLAGPASTAFLPEGRLAGQVGALAFTASGIAWAGYVFGMASIPALRSGSAEGARQSCGIRPTALGD